MEDKEPFLLRWSRRKLEAKVEAPAMPAEELRAKTPAAPPTAATEPRPASTGMSAEYRQFFDPRVDEKLRQSALRNLFGDPHFNVMDGLDTYVDDYSIPDPVPEAMLRKLNQAKALFLFDDEAKEGVAAGEVSAGEGEAAASAKTAASVQGELPAPAAAATDEHAVDSAPPPRPGPGIAT